jgi:hypothetical protein
MENDKYYSYVLKVPEAQNLLSALKIKNIINATICPTKRQAQAIAVFNNNIYRKNGAYLFD